jgi:hypothetical protein
MSHPCRVLWGGVNPVPRVGTLGWYVPPLQGGQGPTGECASVDAGTGWSAHGLLPVEAVGYRLWAVGLVCGCASVDAGVLAWERTHSIADALPSGPARSDRNGCASADP